MKKILHAVEDILDGALDALFTEERLAQMERTERRLAQYVDRTHSKWAMMRRQRNGEFDNIYDEDFES